MRSRAVLLPLACCFSTAFSDPACMASSRRRSRSASLPAVVWISMPGGGASSAVHSRWLPPVSSVPSGNLVHERLASSRPPLDLPARGAHRAGAWRCRGGDAVDQRRMSPRALATARIPASWWSPSTRPPGVAGWTGLGGAGPCRAHLLGAPSARPDPRALALAPAASPGTPCRRRCVDRVPELGLKWPNDVLVDGGARERVEGGRHPRRASRHPDRGPDGRPRDRHQRRADLASCPSR